MEWIKVIILGVIEAITEFLPVSSTGHMILSDQWLKISSNENFTNSFIVIIQLGAIMAIAVLYFKDLWPFYKIENKIKINFEIWLKVLVGVVPAFVLGLFFDDIIDKYLFNPWVVAVALIFYGIILIFVERLKRVKENIKNSTEISKISFKKAFSIGIFQCLSLIPGTSRSAATIIGGMLLGLNREKSAEFSFFMAIPIMAGASFLKIMKSGLKYNLNEWLMIGLGFLVSFVVALGVVKLFMNYIKSKSFAVFGIYRICLGLIILIYLILCCNQ